MNKCQECNTQIDDKRKFCDSSCSITFSNKNRKLSVETKKKISETLSGRIVKCDLHIERKCENCENLFLPSSRLSNKTKRIVSFRFCSEQCTKISRSKNASLSLKGRSGGPRKGGGRSKGSYYNGFWMDSTWEVAFAKRLDTLSITWERNLSKYAFVYVDIQGENRRYFPDFYLPSINKFVEIKGYWTTQTRYKVDQAIKMNKELNSLILLESLQDIESFNIVTI